MRDFHTPLCGCFEDMGSCLCVFCFPGIGSTCLSMQNYSEAREDNCGCLHCLCPPCEIWTRAYLRDRNGMYQDSCQDLCTIMFCSPCAILQDHREAIYLNRNNIGSKKLFKRNPQHTNLIQNSNVPPPNYPPQNYPPQNYQPQNYPPQNYQPQNYQPQNYQPPMYPPNSFNPQYPIQQNNIPPQVIPTETGPNGYNPISKDEK